MPVSVTEKRIKVVPDPQSGRATDTEHDSTLAGEFDRVAEQIYDHMAQAQRIPDSVPRHVGVTWR